MELKLAEEIFRQIAMEEETYETIAKKLGKSKDWIFREMKKYKGHFQIRKREPYCKRTYLRFYYGKEIKDRYLNGESTKSLAKEYGYNDHGIVQLLQDLEATIRPVGYPSRTDQTIFERIDSPEKAYVIGLLTADGSISPKGGISLCLTESDRELLELINEKVFSSTGRIAITHTGEERPRCCLYINGVKLCQQLALHGIIPNKTYSLKDLSSFIPEEFYSDYIRGLYDGNGVCSKCNSRIRIGFCSHNIEFVTNYQAFLCQTLEMRKNKLFNTGGCWQCSWAAKKDLEKFYHFLYDGNPSLYLQRKKEKLKNYLF